MATSEDVTCECGNSMVNREKSTPNWIVYDCVCSACGNRSEKAAAQIRERVIAAAMKGRKR